MRVNLLPALLLHMLVVIAPALAGEPLLFETWTQSYFHPDKFDEFIQAHRAQYTDEYFKCSQEAQRLLREETDVRDRRCDFAPDSGVRGRCRRDNQLRGVDKHLADVDQAIQSRKPWLELESGRNAETAASAAKDLEKSCTPPARDIAKRKKEDLLRALKPLLQCPPERPPDVDPSFKTFELPSDPGG